MTRHRRLLASIRSDQRAARQWRNRRGRRLRAELRRVLGEPSRDLSAVRATVSGPPSAPWADPAYQRILTDIAVNLEGTL